jgi:hypothetical protein
MPNHVHLILVPATEDGLALALGETHRRFTGFVNARMRVTGHLFQGRFGSVVLDEPHLVAAARYVALNPVRARLVRRVQDWPWSSVRAHLKARAGRAGATAVRCLRAKSLRTRTRANCQLCNFEKALPHLHCAGCFISHRGRVIGSLRGRLGLDGRFRSVSGMG